MHENGVIHRDLKLENVMISKDGHVKLTDFGASKANVQKNNFDGRTTTMLRGTIIYAAPEMFESDEIGFSVDYYSLGLVIYGMLTQGEQPF